MIYNTGYFLDVEGLISLEKQERWDEARIMLYHEWCADRLSSAKLIRLLSECWYVLSLWDCCIDTNGLSYQSFKDTLIECVEFGLNNFNKEPRFLCVAGYMISMLPHLFYTGGAEEYSKWDQIGQDMMLRSIKLETNDQIAKVLHLGTSNSDCSYLSAKKQLAPDLNDYFPNDSAIENYFKDILSI